MYKLTTHFLLIEIQVIFDRGLEIFIHNSIRSELFLHNIFEEISCLLNFH